MTGGSILVRVGGKRIKTRQTSDTPTVRHYIKRWKIDPLEIVQ